MLHELTRLRAEYLEMPGLQLTRGQVQRLCGLERAVCERVLDTLVDMRFLYLRQTAPMRGYGLSAPSDPMTDSLRRQR